MKNKPIKARKMWANYYADGIRRIHSTKESARAVRCFIGGKSSVPKTIPVAVIPLDDMEALVEKAKTAFNLEGSGLFTPAMRAALTAIGVLPRQSKGGAK